MPANRRETKRRKRPSPPPAITRRHLAPSVGATVTMPVLRLRIGEPPRVAHAAEISAWTVGFCWN